ncbi:hypothetical protein FY557_05885 [Chryseobacterium sp. SN22]|uniref:SprT-like domain-containing protein n=1 Tax=Chryseobacterium sp. SN22 TaxID=2606431 RepID=UPI0011ED6945|nr:SprT-like domain-containing protein [Chryseobacterium sp. SN22]KAA0129092.1 hypothetical protein FY557_05885 [Chryseobacterium sp. SN22]
MTRKIVSWLACMAVFLFTLNSCVHDEMSSSGQPVSNEYTNLSLWKQDEKYIKNVMKIYAENEDEIRKSGGTPLWNYATTSESFDESFVAVPIVSGDRVTSVLKIPRHGRKVYFYYTNDPQDIEFFQGLVFARTKKAAKADASYAQSERTSCTRQSIAVWIPDNESSPDPSSGSGHWSTRSYIKCIQLIDNCVGIVNANGVCEMGGGNEGYDYSGGGDEGNNEEDNIISQLQNYPCAESLVQQLPNLDNELANAMRQIFQNNENYNITFRSRSNMGNIDGVTFTSHSNTEGFTAIISLNDQVLTNATKEYILVTMYHEVIHAFLDYEKFRLGDTAFQDQYPGVIVGYDYTADGTVVNRYTYIDGHQQLIPFLTTLQNILSAYNPNLPHDVVVAMARTGIATTTQAQYQLNSNEKNTTLGNHKGTKCP